ncbi:MAG TPA: hypothetical protein VD789_11135 [Thermomicrobiales bacterium]|jgi:hypothetical protein|nr:hypothetical protein [Thermomicrobiales bacterium]
MEIFEEMGGCVMIGIVALILLFLVVCVAVVFFGVAITDVFN